MHMHQWDDDLQTEDLESYEVQHQSHFQELAHTHSPRLLTYVLSVGSLVKESVFPSPLRNKIGNAGRVN